MLTINIRFTDRQGLNLAADYHYDGALLHIVKQMEPLGRRFEKQDFRLLSVECLQANGWEYERFLSGYEFDDVLDFVVDMRNVFETCQCSRAGPLTSNI